jgi:hypothetical protein
MTAVVVLLLAQGVLGAVDTIWYHEIVAGLPRRPDRHRTELRLHAGRDAVYAVLYGTIGWTAWRGAWAGVLIALVATEVVITMADFVVEDRTRTLSGGERVLHSTMAIVYGAMLMRLAPVLAGWAGEPTALARADEVPAALAAIATVFGAGIALSGARDARASRTAGLRTSTRRGPGAACSTRAWRT